MANTTNMMSIAPNQAASSRNVSHSTRPKYKSASHSDSKNFSATLNKFNEKVDDIRQSIQNLKDTIDKSTQAESDAKQVDEITDTDVQGMNDIPQDATKQDEKITATPEDNSKVTTSMPKDKITPADIFIGANTSVETAKVPDALTVTTEDVAPVAENISVKENVDDSNVTDNQIAQNPWAASNMAYMFTMNTESLLATKSIESQTTQQVTAVAGVQEVKSTQSLMSIMPQSTNESAQTMLNALGGQSWRQINAQPLQQQQTIQQQPLTQMQAQTVEQSQVISQNQSQSVNTQQTIQQQLLTQMQSQPVEQPQIISQNQSQPVNTQQTIQQQLLTQIQTQTVEQPQIISQNQSQPVNTQQVIQPLTQTQPVEQPQIISQNQSQLVNTQQTIQQQPLTQMQTVEQPQIISQNQSQPVNTQQTIQQQPLTQTQTQTVEQPQIISQNQSQPVNTQQTIQQQPLAQTQAQTVEQLRIISQNQSQPVNTQQTIQQQPLTQTQTVEQPQIILQNQSQPVNTQQTIQQQPLTQTQTQPVEQPQIISQNQSQPVNTQQTIQQQPLTQIQAQTVEQPQIISQNLSQPVNTQQPIQQQPLTQMQTQTVEQPQIIQQQPQIQAQVVESKTTVQNLSDVLGVNVQTEDAPTTAPIIQLQSTSQQFNQDTNARQDAQNFGSQFMQTVTNTEAQTQTNSTGGEIFAANLASTNDTAPTQQTTQPQNVDAPLPTPEDFDVPGQIVRQARLIRAAENTEMVIKLNPEHLGEMTLRISVSQNGAVSASFHSDNAQVRTIIENSLVQLRQELNNQGLKVDNVQVYAGLGDGSSLMNGRGGQAWQQNRQQRQGNRRIDFDALEREADATTPVAENIATDGVDYSV
ncbi:MAG: hypothetical protein K6G55_00125 [Selenomonadaceae bacterium]|nr:hypothetical protein [Selenomonadaceae bacterium]